MVKLYREKVSTEADAIEAEFKDMILGYDREIIGAAQARRQFGSERFLPVITDNDRIVSGNEIPAYVQELKKLVRDWQRFQGDSCYVDEDGEVC